MDPQVRLADVAARPTLVVAAATTWAKFPQTWPVLSQEVWELLRANGVTSGCPNVMLYLDDEPHVEVGVLYAGELPLSGGVQISALPAGRIATATHRGAYSDLGSAHDAIHAWAGEQRLELSRTRWEVYGPHDADPEKVSVEVSWLSA